MRINLHIERLVLDGLPLNAAQGVQIRRAVTRELTALLAGGKVHDALRSGANVDRVVAPAIRLAQDTGAAHLGRQIAGAVFGGIAK